MKKVAVLSALAIAALAGTASAQVQLQLRIVPQNGNPPGTVTDAASASPVLATDAAGAARTRRFEVQYRILDLNTGDAIVPAGLSSMQFNIVATNASSGSVIDRAVLSRFEAQLAGSTPPSSTDATGANSNGATGLHRPFRGGIPSPAPNNTAPSNGLVANSAASHAITLITPLALSQSDQGNANIGQDPNSWYGLYSFQFTAGIDYASDTTVNFVANAIPDAQTGNAFGYFNDGDPVPQTSANAVGGSASLLVNAVPAPGSVALLGLGGLIAGRRRRA